MITRRAPLAVVGVAHVSDLYPNVKYKLALLQEAASPLMQVHDLGSGSLAQTATSGGLLARCAFGLHFLWAHLCVFSQTLLRPVTAVYLPYPSVLMLLFYSLWPRRLRPRLVADAFISLYDTAVLDRELLRKTGWLARMLRILEKRAYATADVVLVDTRENGMHYAELFSLTPERFVEMPLSLPPLTPLPHKPAGQSGFRCLFMGSMVPLQGISTILAAARLLQEQGDIEFRIIGTGQQAALVEDFIKENPQVKLIWVHELVPTERLIAEIGEADLCLGIFGSSAKATRVLPYKLYYYALLGRPFLTRHSATLNRLAGPSLLCDNTADALATRIHALSKDSEELATCAAASLALGSVVGDQKLMQERLLALLLPEKGN